MNRYYSILRPVGIGTFPKPAGNEVKTIRNFDRREFVEEISREAWGYIEYEQELSERDAKNYDLISGKGVDSIVSNMITSDRTPILSEKRKAKTMGKYDPKNNAYVNNYKKEHCKKISVEVRKDYYEDVLFPAAESAGLSVHGYIKEAIREKIERESK